MIKGFDVSHWQGKRGVATMLSRVPDAKFVIIKATEGTTYVDPTWEQNATDAAASGLVTGFYHYARPEKNNTPESEARHFVDTVRKHIGTSVLALDYEGAALQYGYKWALTWLQEVYNLTGVRPLIYLQGSAVKQFKQIANENFGLWIAAWTTREKMLSYLDGWTFITMWQYSNSGGELDLNEFNGNEGQFLLYAAVDEEWVLQQENNKPTLEGQGYCGCKCCDIVW